MGTDRSVTRAAVEAAVRSCSPQRPGESEQDWWLRIGKQVTHDTETVVSWFELRDRWQQMIGATYAWP